MASYGGAGVARSLYYYRTGEVLDYPMIRRLKNITRNSTMTRGSAAHELLSELRFSHDNVTLYIETHDRSLFISFWFFSACDRADASLDFTAVYNANKHILHTINLLERKGGEENQSEEPLSEMAALEIQSTRSSMLIEGKMLLGHFPLLNIL
jgi:hypothetical protein